jgi:hypothetical protein
MAKKNMVTEAKETIVNAAAAAVLAAADFVSNKLSELEAKKATRSEGASGRPAKKRAKATVKAPAKKKAAKKSPRRIAKKKSAAKRARG